MIKKYKDYDIIIIKKKIKNTYIRVKDDKIVITTNYLMPNIYINKIIKDNYNSIDKMISKIEQKKKEQDEFYLFGKHYLIKFDNTISDIIINEKNIIVKNKEKLDSYLDLVIKETFSKHLEYWYNKFEEKIPVPNLKIRKMKSRWGVCNIKNHNITLNYYLYKYDINCLDYVIVHELSHFIEGNHSKNFWSVVFKYYPNYKEIRKKLRS